MIYQNLHKYTTFIKDNTDLDQYIFDSWFISLLNWYTEKLISTYCIISLELTKSNLKPIYEKKLQINL